MVDRLGISVEAAVSRHSSQRIAAPASDVAQHRIACDLRIVPLVEVSVAIEDDVHSVGREHAFKVVWAIEEPIRALRAAVRVEGVVPERKPVRRGVTGQVVGEPGQLGSANRAACDRTVEVRLPVAQVSTRRIAPSPIEDVEPGAAPIERIPAARVGLGRRTQRPGAAVGVALITAAALRAGCDGRVLGPVLEVGHAAAEAVISRRRERGDCPSDLRPVLGTKRVASPQVAILGLRARVVDVVPHRDDESGLGGRYPGEDVGLIRGSRAPVAYHSKAEGVGGA